MGKVVIMGELLPVLGRFILLFQLRAHLRSKMFPTTSSKRGWHDLNFLNCPRDYFLCFRTLFFPLLNCWLFFLSLASMGLFKT